MRGSFSTILITGGTGSFGDALTRFLLADTSSTIRIFSRDEDKQEIMARTFARHADRLRFLIGDIRDLSRTTIALRDVDCVFHAAALKRIPQCTPQ
jgi:FlaA1/EpsC-like NDP-sugar epimerase